MTDLSEINWRRSSFCNSSTCVEIAFSDSHVAMRDGKHRDRHTLIFTKAEWRAFLDAARKGEFDCLPEGL
jgi:hypothetical protein